MKILSEYAERELHGREELRTFLIPSLGPQKSLLSGIYVVFTHFWNKLFFSFYVNWRDRPPGYWSQNENDQGGHPLNRDPYIRDHLLYRMIQNFASPALPGQNGAGPSKNDYIT